MKKNALVLPVATATLLAVGIVATIAVAQETTTTTYVPKGTVVVKKYYDKNANGYRETGEPWLTGWPMNLSGNGVDSTKGSTATFTGIAAGSGYWVTEAKPIETNWFQSAPKVNGAPINPVPISVYAYHTTTVKFGNYCKKPSGGRTPGYWSNQNGLATLNDGGELATELSLLSSLNLVDGSGTAFNPTTYTSFRTWLLGGNAVNMAYMLSVHTAAMTLNVEAGFVNGDAYFIPCNCTIDELLADANTSLGLYPLTLSGHPQRDDQETLKNWLDQLNNGALVIPPSPCRKTFYTY